MPISKYIPTAFVSTLPSSAIDGQEIYYQASGVMAASGNVWHLRYNAASASSYKWEYVGGSPISNEIATAESTTSTSYTDLATPGPIINVPLAGDYLCTFSSFTVFSFTTIKVGNAAASDVNAVQRSNVSAGYEAGGSTLLLTGVSASTDLRVQYKVVTTSGGTAQSEARRLRVIPVRVG